MTEHLKYMQHRRKWDVIPELLGNLKSRTEGQFYKLKVILKNQSSIKIITQYTFYWNSEVARILQEDHHGDNSREYQYKKLWHETALNERQNVWRNYGKKGFWAQRFISGQAPSVTARKHAVIKHCFRKMYLAGVANR